MTKIKGLVLLALFGFFLTFTLTSYADVVNKSIKILEKKSADSRKLEWICKKFCVLYTV